jgi:surface protein
MFSEARAFNQDLSSWDTGSVTEMWYMFSDATNFDQNIGAWNIESLTDASEMFANVTLSLANYNGLLVGWNAQEENSGVSFSGGNSMYSAGLPHGPMPTSLTSSRGQLQTVVCRRGRARRSPFKLFNRTKR